MRRQSFERCALALLSCLFLWTGIPAIAADKQLRIASLVPKNSLYHRQLMEVGEAWRGAQEGPAKYLIYKDWDRHPL